MRNAIAVMNTKGGVGKSTLVLAIAETLSSQFHKNVLIIDSDSQASISAMLLSVANLHRLQSDGLTIVDLLVASVLNNVAVDWPRFVVGGVSDVDEARTVYLIPSDMQLTLFEREVSKESLHARLRTSIGGLLNHVRSVFDVVLIDCPPGLSILTESWLREADFHVSPTKPDYVSTCGLEVFRRFKSLNPEMGFAENLGVLINMKESHSSVDGDYQRWLAKNPANRVFTHTVPRTSALQHAAQLSAVERSYRQVSRRFGVSIKGICEELLGGSLPPRRRVRRYRRCRRKLCSPKRRPNRCRLRRPPGPAGSRCPPRSSTPTSFATRSAQRPCAPSSPTRRASPATSRSR
jgi:chromosome partitioning protein